jgi:nitrilase
MKDLLKVAVVQESSIPFNATETARKVCALIREAADNGAELIVFPEAFLGTYPKGLNFDAPVGYRDPKGRDDYLLYYKGAVSLDGEEIASIIQTVHETNTFVVLGVIERDAGTLYCTVLYIDAEKGLVGKHRKLMPTGSERLVWGFGDGSTLDVVDSSLGKIGAVICWENYMPTLRMVMYAQGVEIYCAPTADDRDTWLSSMRHIALEGRCFVLSACQCIKRSEYDENYRSVIDFAAEDFVMRGGSCIIGPLGEILVPPVYNEKTILYANLRQDDLIKSKLDFDVVGHYSRPDVFQLSVDTSEHKVVNLNPQE